MGSLAGDKQLFIPSGFYKGCKVAIKRINEKNIHLNRAQMLELKKVCYFFNFLKSSEASKLFSLVADERYSP